MIFPVISSICLVFSFSVSWARNDTAFNADGTIRQITQFNAEGLEHGKKWGFNRQGRIVLECEFKDGMYHGHSRTWHDNGVLESKGFSKNNNSHGWRCNWDSLGFLFDSTRYDMGKKIEDFNFFNHSNKISTHQYFFFHPQTGQRLLAMEDQFNPNGQIISQIRNGNGISFDIKHSGRYDGIIMYKNGDSDFMDYINVERHPNDPRHKRVPIPKSKHIPWDVKKYGSVELPDTAE